MKSPADVQRLKKILDLCKIIRTAIGVADGYCEVKNVVHHTRLKDVFEKLIIVNRPTRLYFKNPPFIGGMGISVETFQYLAFPPEKHRYNYLI